MYLSFCTLVLFMSGLPWWLSCKESTCKWRRCSFDPWVGKIPWRREWQPTPVLLPGRFHGQRSLAGCSPWGHRVRQDCNWAHTRAFHIWCKSAQCLECSQMETSWGWMDGADVELASWGVFACKSRKDRTKRPVSEEAPRVQGPPLFVCWPGARVTGGDTALHAVWRPWSLGQGHLLLAAELAPQAGCWWVAASEGLLLWNRRRDAHRGRRGCGSEWGGGLGGRGNIAATGVRGSRLRDTDGRVGGGAVGSEPRREKEQEAAQNPRRLLDSASSGWGAKRAGHRHRWVRKPGGTSLQRGSARPR